jgi:hypothetical protein
LFVNFTQRREQEMKHRVMLMEHREQLGDNPTDSSVQLETPPDDSGSQSPQTQPTPTPQDSPTDDPRDRYARILEETLRDQNRQIQALQSQITTPAAPATPAPSAEDLKTQFYNDPVNTTRSIVEEALSRTIAPLNDFVRGLRIEGSPYDRMLSKFRADARFAPVLQDPHVLAAVEKIMGAAELNEVNMQSAIVHAMGLKSMGLLGTMVEAPRSNEPAPAPAAPTPTPSTVIPPHVRPSGSPGPAGPTNNAPRARQLTETEKRLARENRMTDEQYLKWLEAPADGVATADFDKPPKPR